MPTDFNRALDPAYVRFGAPATYVAPGGPATAVTILRRNADSLAAGFGGAGLRLQPALQKAAAVVSLRASEVAEPARGARLILAGTEYPVEDVAGDTLALEWVLVLGRGSKL